MKFQKTKTDNLYHRKYNGMDYVMINSSVIVDEKWMQVVGVYEEAKMADNCANREIGKIKNGVKELKSFLTYKNTVHYGFGKFVECKKCKVSFNENVLIVNKVFIPCFNTDSFSSALKDLLFHFDYNSDDYFEDELYLTCDLMEEISKYEF